MEKIGKHMSDVVETFSPMFTGYVFAYLQKKFLEEDTADQQEIYIFMLHIIFGISIWHI